MAFRFPLRLLLLTTVFAWAASLRAADPVDAAAAAETSASDTVELSEAASFLRIGEKLVFKLSWGLVSGAGLTTIETLPPEGSDGLVRVRVTTESRGLVKALYPLENNSTCYIDPKTGRPMRTEIEGHGGSRESRSTTIFDYEEGLVKHTDHVRPHRSGTADLPDETAYDIMVTMLKLRDNPPKPGEVRNVKIAFDDDIYDIELNAIEKDRVKTPEGRFDAVMIEPEQRGELKGFFAKGGSMKFWISQEERPQIVRMDFRVKIGTITSVLIEEGRGESDE